MKLRINTTLFAIICFLFSSHIMASAIIASAIDEGGQKSKTSERIYLIDNREPKTITREQVDVLASPQHAVIDLLGLPPENPSVISKEVLAIDNGRKNMAVFAPPTKVIEKPKLAISRSQIVAYIIDLTLGSETQLKQAKLCGISNPKIGLQQVEVEALELKKLREQDIPFKIVGGVSEFTVRRSDKDTPFKETRTSTYNGESTFSETNVIEESPAIKQVTKLDTGYRYLVWDPNPDYFLPDGYGVWVTWPQGFAPSGATVTSVQYRLWMGEEDSGQTDFWCSDYIISLSSEQHGKDYTVCKVWDRDGGHTDNGEDDDSADDYDIYLNWRSTTYFNGEDANQKWYAFVGDFAPGDDGNINYIEIKVYWETQVQNDFAAVDCYGADPSDIWTPVSTFDEGDNVEICFKWTLTGPNVAATTAIRLDDGSIRTSSQEYQAGTWCSHWTWENATVGWHRIRGWCDYNNDVAETDEGNNDRDEAQAFYVEPTSPPPSDHLVLDSGDYNGDGTSDIAIYRGSSGMWSVRGVTRVYFGSASDLPVAGDYDGDGTADIGVFRGSSGLWAIRGVTRIYFGSSLDTPVPGDYDGNGACDPGIFRESSGLWGLRGVSRIYFGTFDDTVVPGDYNGDGTDDVALFRASSGLWALRGISRAYFGGSQDLPVSGDYNGDGTWETAIFRSSAGMWAVRGVTRAYCGSSSDHPVPADYNGDLTDDIGIFRSSSGLWAIRAITRTYFGTSGDLPVTR